MRVPRQLVMYTRVFIQREESCAEDLHLTIRMEKTWVRLPLDAFFFSRNIPFPPSGVGGCEERWIDPSTTGTRPEKERGGGGVRMLRDQNRVPIF